MKIIKKIVIENRAYGIFALSDLFNFKRGSGTKSKEGNYPQITASAKDNGHAGFSDIYKFENSFSFADVSGTCFWHPYKFDASQHAFVAIPKFSISDFNTMEGLASYISSYTTYKRFSFGRFCSLERLKEQTVALPIVNDEIDWQFIHDSYKETISRIYKKQMEKLQEKINNLDTNFIKPEFN